MDCCSRRRPRRSRRSPPIQSTSAPTSASPPSCTPGDRASITTLTSTASCRAAVSPPTARAGFDAGRDFFLPVRVLSRLFRRLFLEGLVAAFDAGELQFFSDLVALKDREAFKAYLAPLRTREWVVYAKRPFAGPKQVLAYLARYTHRVAIGNSRLLELTDEHVSFRWKDYRENGDHKNKVMKLAVGEFMRRFLLHVLPDGFHRIRHYGLFANGHRADKVTLCRKLLNVSPTSKRK